MEPANGGSSIHERQAIPARLQGTISVHKGPVHVARLNAAGRYILTGGADRQIHLFNATNVDAQAREAAGVVAPIKTYSAHSGAVLGLSIAHDNATFVSGGEDRNVLVWDVTTGSVVRRLSAHTGATHVVQYCGAASGPTSTSNSGSTSGAGDSVVAAAGFDTVLRFYDMRARGAWKPIMECREASDTILCMAVHKDCVYTGSVDGVLRTYDLRAGELREDTLDRAITSVTPAQASASLLVSLLARSSGKDSKRGDAERATHILLDLEDGSHLQTISHGGRNVSYRCHSTFCGDNDATIAAGDEDGCIRTWNVLSGDEMRAPSLGLESKGTSLGAGPHQKAVLWTEYNAKNGGKMVTAGADGRVKIWGVT